MRLSREKINQISHVMMKAFMRDENIEIFRDENDIRLEIVRIITEELKIEEALDQEVRKRLESYKRKMVEGTAEWEILYQKIYEEEANKSKR